MSSRLDPVCVFFSLACLKSSFPAHAHHSQIKYFHKTVICREDRLTYGDFMAIYTTFLMISPSLLACKWIESATILMPDCIKMKCASPIKSSRKLKHYENIALPLHFMKYAIGIIIAIH